LHRADLSGFLAARVTDRFGAGQLFFEFRTKERWDGAIPRPAVLAHRFAYNHSYLVPADSGRADLLRGDSITMYPYGDRTSLRIEVTEIDAAQRRARLLATETPPSRPRRVGSRRVSHGVKVGGGGWVIVDGQPVPVPPRSPMAAVLRQVALHERSQGATDPRIRDSGQREARQAILAHMGKLIDRQRQPTSPAPRVRPKPKKTMGPKRTQARKSKPRPKKHTARR
jgi:hypothetical protein